jgi:hypothetical protein
LELLLQPADTAGGYTIVNFSTPGNPKQFRVRQWTDSLLISRNVLDAREKTKTQRFDVDHAFQPEKLLLITMTSGPKRTIVYLKGRQARVLPEFIFTLNDLAGQIVIGTSATEYHPWRGEIHGLAVYSKEFASDEVLRNCENWTARGDAGEDLKGTIARYTFTEGARDEIHNTVASGTDLEIPRSFFIPYKPMLESPAKEFEPNRAYLEDLLLNIAGFVLVGFLGCAYLGATVFSLLTRSRGPDLPLHTQKELRVYLPYIHCWRLLHEYGAGFSIRKQSGGSAAETISTEVQGSGHLSTRG